MNNSVKAVILAAGKGTRMKSETPKVLHKILNKTILGYVLDAVNATGEVAENYVIVGHQAELVENFVKENYSNAKCCLQSPQLGTGHAVYQAYDSLKGFDGEVVILNGDIPLITPETLKEFIAAHREHKASLTVMSAIFNDPSNYGRIIRDEKGSVKAIIEEKDATPAQKKIQEINTGVYLLNWKDMSDAFLHLDSNNAQGEYYLTDIVKWAIANGLKTEAYVLKNNEESFGINSKIQLAQAGKILNKRTLYKLMEDGVTIVDPDTTYISCDTEIGADTIVYPCTYIEGKNKIGKDCKIGPFARLRGDVEIGDNVKIGNFVEVKKSVIKSNTNVSHLSYIGDSELGSGVNIGAGTITANYDPISKVKSRTVLEDGANTGSNTVLVAPGTLKEHAMTAAGSVVSKNIEKDALAITRAPLRVISGWVSRLKKHD